MSSPDPDGPSSPRPERRSAKVDPWEARERERARYSRAPRSRSSSNNAADELWSETDLSLRENLPVLGLLIAIFALVASGIPSLDAQNRYLCLQIGTFLSLLLLGACRSFQENMLTALRRGPNPWFLALLGWTTFSFLSSPYRNFATPEFLRIVSAIGIYFVAGYTLRSPRQTSFALVGLLGAGSLVSLVDFAQVGAHGRQTSLSDAFSVLGTHQHAGSLLTLLFPVSLCFALHPRIEEKRRLLATGSALVLGVALLASRSRSGWLSVLVALLALATFYVRYVRPQEEPTVTRKQPLWQVFLTSPVTQLVVALVVFLGITNLAPLVSQRASVVHALDDASFTGRLAIWHGAKLMIALKPITGWGLGSFPILQGQFSHTGDDTIAVVLQGSSHFNNAHNYYLQWSAETGLVGLFLHIGVLSAFLLSVLSLLPRVKTPFQVAMLSGSFGIVLASLVDSLFSPMYHFPGIWAILYAMMGLGMAAMRSPSTTTAPVTPPSPTVWGGSLACATLVVLSLLLWTNQEMHPGKTERRGTLQVVATPLGPIEPGNSVQWRAIFTDGQGTVHSTMPGTVWTVDAESLVQRQSQQELLSLHPDESGDTRLRSTDVNKPLESVLRIVVPRTATPQSTMTVKATYRDDYGRLYEAWSSKRIGNIRTP